MHSNCIFPSLNSYFPPPLLKAERGFNGSLSKDMFLFSSNTLTQPYYSELLINGFPLNVMKLNRIWKVK